MFVLINVTDNPWIVALLLFVQVVMPLLQSSAADNEGVSLALNVAVLFLLGLSFLTFWKVARFCCKLYQLRGRVQKSTMDTLYMLLEPALLTLLLPCWCCDYRSILIWVGWPTSERPTRGWQM